MFRTTIALAALLALGGCIEIPQESATAFQAAAAPQEPRISGMTAEETYEDRTVDCNSGGGIQLPPRFCAERTLVVTGRIGVDHLPIDLSAANGEVAIVPSAGDAWSFSATYRVSAPTQEMAREGLDTAWSWSHEEDGRHELRAGPTPVTGTNLLGPSVSVAQYRIELPPWVEIDLKAETDNGRISVIGYEMGSVDLETDNGRIELRGAVRDIRAKTDNGRIDLDVTPRGGAFDLTTDNGRIEVRVPVASAYGYDVTAKTDNGRIRIALGAGDMREDDDGATFRSERYDARPVRTTMALETDNGRIEVGGG